VKISNEKRQVVMVSTGLGSEVEMESLPLDQNIIYLKAACNFKDKADLGNFFYSLDNKSWTPIGKLLKMEYTLPHFMGYRFGLFNYATKTTGGFVDFDWYHIE